MKRPSAKWLVVILLVYILLFLGMLAVGGHLLWQMGMIRDLIDPIVPLLLILVYGSGSFLAEFICLSLFYPAEYPKNEPKGRSSLCCMVRLYRRRQCGRLFLQS